MLKVLEKIIIPLKMDWGVTFKTSDVELKKNVDIVKIVIKI